MNFDYKKYKFFYTADFETSTEQWNIKVARVWAWDICDTKLNHITGTNIESFINHIKQFNKCLFSFHNLSYDGTYILDYLLRNGYKFTESSEPKINEFTTIITPFCVHYAYQIHFENGNIVTINDSFKHNSQSVETLAKTYKLSILKGHIDYDLYREEGHVLTDEEIAYIHNDTEIMMRILLEDLNDGFTSFTESGNSKKFFKPTIGKNKQQYEATFPILSDYEDEFVRNAYRGGYCHLKKEHFNQLKGKMMSVDINSMYPSMMLHKPLPYGEGLHCNGYAPLSNEYKMLSKSCDNLVFVQRFTCMFTIKKNHVPTISGKSFHTTVKELYLYDSGNKICELYLTNIDLELFFENYYVYDLNFIDAYIYETKCGVQVTEEQAKTMTVDEIIEKDGQGSFYYNYLYPWRMQKEHTTGGQRNRAKKQQNIAYGWQATSKNGELSFPYLDSHDKIAYKRYKGTPRKGGYIPIACFITAYSRQFLIRSILDNYDRFVYCDTDSMYLLGQETPNLPIHKTLYGYFKIEHYIKQAKFLGCKRYIYETEEYSEDPNQLIVKCCGAPVEITKQMTFENFLPYVDGTQQGVFNGKLLSKIVTGGKHLVETTYKLNC